MRAALAAAALCAAGVLARAEGSALKPAGQVTGTRGFKAALKCPRGTAPAAESGALGARRCVPVAAAPDASGTAPLLREPSARRHEIPGELSFELPGGFRLQDAWAEEVPTLHLSLDDGSPGKPATVVLTKIEPRQPSFQDLDAAIAKDKEWLGATQAPPIVVSGIKARVTQVAGETRSVYLPLPGGAYYSIVYTAPAGTYAARLADFERLLKSLTLAARAR